MTASIFISHIHEEADLAVLLKMHLDDEFAGLVPIFVSSDGESIGAGKNFLQAIGNNLRNCTGAIYLLSEASLARPWINFEFGALYARNLLTPERPEHVPTIPLCHSGLSLGELPAPFGLLNAKLAGSPSHLQQTFAALESAIGRTPSKLRTPFDVLANKVHKFELTYSRKRHISAAITLLGHDWTNFCKYATENPIGPWFELGGIVEGHSLGEMRVLGSKLAPDVRFVEGGPASIVTTGPLGNTSRSGIKFVLHFRRSFLDNLL